MRGALSCESSGSGTLSDESVPEPEVTPDLVACRICGAGYATEPMLQRIGSPPSRRRCRGMLRASPSPGLPGMQKKDRGGEGCRPAGA